MTKRILLYLSALILLGCAAHQPPATTNAPLPASTAAATTAPAANPDMEPPATHPSPAKIIIGNWELDAQATLKVNATLKEQDYAMLQRWLKEEPFTVEITDRDYISRSSKATIADRYKVLEIKDDGSVRIELTRPGRVETTTRYQNLSVERGLLFLRDRYPEILWVMKRTQATTTPATLP